MNCVFIDKDNEVNIEPVAKSHVKFIYDLSNNDVLMEIFHDKGTTIEEWESFIEAWKNDEDEQNYIISKSCDGTYVGWVGINGLLSEEIIGWIKIIAISPEHWSNGYGSIAIDRVKEVFKLKGFKKIQLWTDACNERARKCYESKGFVVVETKPRKIGNLDIVVDRVLMSCIL